MHEAFWEKRSCRSFEMAETDFFSAALRQIHPRGGRGARSVVFEPRRKTIYPASLGRGRETGRGRVVSRCFLADEDRRFISTGIGGRLGAPYLPPLTSLRTTVTRARCRQYYFLLSLLWILPRLCRINTSGRACTSSPLVVFFLSLGFLVIPRFLMKPDFL